ncbi:hypothetical protein BJY04DRAFT_41847 [Aspergillus karnatakaensis]|uniref:uncharacterized protein n=1 Tax=Aspergillus karnatakaensis TaxID=1810916 RepID=UPI003CCE495D
MTMSGQGSGGHKEPPDVEVVIPTRGYKGWAILSSDETEPLRPSRHIGTAAILESHIFPPNKKRARIAPERLDSPSTMQRDRVQPLKEHPSDIQTPASVSAIDPRREVARLRLENDLHALVESQEIQALQAEVKRLTDLKSELNRTIHQLISDHGGGDRTAAVSHDDSREREIEEHVSTIKHLESSLGMAFEHDALRSKVKTMDHLSGLADIGKAMTSIKLAVIRVADLLSDCLHPPRETLGALRKHPNLRALVKDTVKENSILHALPDLTFRALLFHIMCHNIFLSDIWTGLHGEGFMLRAYHTVIQQTTGIKFADTFHKAAFLHMIDHDQKFSSCFLAANAKELQQHTLELLSPLLDPGKLTNKKSDILRVLGHFYLEAFTFRARCLPPDGTRYEIIQFQPGDLFDSKTMEAQDVTGKGLTELEHGTKRRVKLCVHGVVVAHRDETLKAEELQTLKSISQPFLPSRPRGRNRRASGDFITGKAIVVVE